jgi:hypothetical protein
MRNCRGLHVLDPFLAGTKKAPAARPMHGWADGASSCRPGVLPGKAGFQYWNLQVANLVVAARLVNACAACPIRGSERSAGYAPAWRWLPRLPSSPAAVHSQQWLSARDILRVGSAVSRRWQPGPLSLRNSCLRPGECCGAGASLSCSNRRAATGHYARAQSRCCIDPDQ